MIDALRRLGIRVDVSADATQVTVHGCAGLLPGSQAELYVGDSGTTMRFLTALVALGSGTYYLHGTPRMHERPIGDLARALETLGVTTRMHSPDECPPLTVVASGLRGGAVVLPGNVSSQFASALLMAAPYAAADLSILIQGELVSRPYVAMTAAVMRRFGAVVEEGGLSPGSPPAATAAFEAKSLAPPAGWLVRRGGYRGTRLAIEPDASAAGYFWGAAAIAGGEICTAGLDFGSLQGDVRLAHVLASMGCDVAEQHGGIRVRGPARRGVTVDMRDFSDAVPTLAAVALFMSGPTVIRGVGHIRLKETDRIGNLAKELRRLGAQVTEFDDGMAIMPSETIRPAVLETYRDHRMAMGLALVGLRVAGIRIVDPLCVAKTYPGYFRDLAACCVLEK
jgi:3-phosphoshikimate 1-carboxyvinyltransferase